MEPPAAFSTISAPAHNSPSEPTITYHLALPSLVFKCEPEGSWNPQLPSPLPPCLTCHKSNLPPPSLAFKCEPEGSWNPWALPQHSPPTPSQILLVPPPTTLPRVQMRAGGFAQPQGAVSTFSTP